MNSVLIVFESKYGQAEKIAAFAREVACRRGLRAEALRVDAAEWIDVAAYPAVIVVAPIYLGRHPRAIEGFLRSHADVLSTRQTAFVSVSNSAANARAAVRANAVRIANVFVASVGLRPKVVLTVGGAIAYPRYGFLLRFVMKYIARRAGEPQDTSRIHELTDWRSLDEVLSRFFESVSTERVATTDAKADVGRSRIDESGIQPLATIRAAAAQT